jgi:hypothetical protein
MSTGPTHATTATIDGASGKTANATADASDIVLDANGNAGTMTAATVKNGTYTGDVNATATGATVLGDAEARRRAALAVAKKKELDNLERESQLEAKPKTLFQQLRARMETLLDTPFFVQNSDDSVFDIEDEISDFKNNPKDISELLYGQIAGRLSTVENTFENQNTSRERKIKKLTDLTDVLNPRN